MKEISRAQLGIFTLSILFVTALGASAQLPARSTPDLDARRAGMKQVTDNDRIRAAKEADEKARVAKAERQALVAEAFKRLQILHNEMLLLADSKAIDTKTASDGVTEIKTRAIQLRANLVLPEAAKPDPNEKPVSSSMPLKESLIKLCEFIRGAATNINKSASEKEAGAVARLDLDRVVDLSDKILARYGPQPPAVTP